jgi:hypothetical protein
MTTDNLLDRLSEPFPADEIDWKPQALSADKTRALAVPFVDARTVMDRLDAVLGPGGWQDDYQTLDDGSAVCRLRVRIGGEWVTKTDVGGASDQKDAGDRRKASFSDALKRAGIKLGIARYLYRLPKQWCDYDGKANTFKTTPQLPAWATPWISAAEAETLQQLIDQAHVDLDKFTAYFGVDRVEHLPAARFAEAEARLPAGINHERSPLMNRHVCRRQIDWLVRDCGWRTIIECLVGASLDRANEQADLGKHRGSWRWIQLADHLRRGMNVYVPPTEG